MYTHVYIYIYICIYIHYIYIYIYREREICTYYELPLPRQQQVPLFKVADLEVSLRSLKAWLLTHSLVPYHPRVALAARLVLRSESLSPVLSGCMYSENVAAGYYKVVTVHTTTK